MSSKDGKTAAPAVLDLDALYGQAAQPRHIRFGDKAYELRSMSSFGPLELMQFQKLVAAMKKLPRDLMAVMNSSQAPTPKQQKQAADVVRTVDNLVTFMCPDLPLTNLPFAAKMNVINFFYKGAAADKDTSKKARSPRTGAVSTRGSRSGTA